jgi:uncharacterized protein YbjT (DUF2867 family)
MNLLIFGGTGPTGKNLVSQALELGHTVCVLARRPEAVTLKHDRLTVVKGDILDPASLDAAIPGRDAVLSALGIRKLGKNTIISDGTRNILASMEKHGIRRFICETSLGVGDSKGHTAWFFDKVIQPFILKNVFDDKEVQEQLIRQSNLDWIIVRPSGLTNGAKKGTYKTWVGTPPTGLKNWISRADVAEFMLKQLTDDAYVKKAVGISD